MEKIAKDPKGKKALAYHSGKLYSSHPIMKEPGKIGILTTKRCDNQEELSLAYTPYVGACVEAISDNPERLTELTGYGNKGAVITDGSAILGYGDLGPRAATPVMEGKSILFKVFGDVNMDALEIRLKEPKEIVDFIMALEPTYAGINLEDIAAPRCFEIERALQEKYQGFIFHDDQHGTAVISLAGLYNALTLVELEIKKAKVVINGAGAAAIASARLYRRAGIKDIVMLDRHGVLYPGRPYPLNSYKKEFTRTLSELGIKPDRKGRVSLEKAIRGADIFLGCSAGRVLSAAMVKSMNRDAIIIALANPIPEIEPPEAYSAGAAIVATGRSDYPNQMNNVLGFPGIFRGALDALIGKTTDDIKLAAAQALRDLAHQPVPAALKRKYPRDHRRKIFEGENPLKPEYIVPLALDERVPVEVAAAVFRTAHQKGIARQRLPKGSREVENYLPRYKKKIANRIKIQRDLRKLICGQFTGGRES